MDLPDLSVLAGVSSGAFHELVRGTFEVILKRRTEEDFRSTHLADGLNEPDDSLAGSLAELDAIDSKKAFAGLASTILDSARNGLSSENFG